MLDESIKEQLKGYFEKIQYEVTLDLTKSSHESYSELKEMLETISSLSSQIKVRERNLIDANATDINSADINATEGKDPESRGSESDLHFSVKSKSSEGIHFKGIPGGHEFSSLVLAILQSGGHPHKLDQGITEVISSLDGPMKFETVISLDCHNCPEVVQTLNTLSLVNRNISHTMIDGALFPELVNERKIQGVPAVFLNGEPFANGKMDAGQIIEKLLSKSGNKGASFDKDVKHLSNSSDSSAEKTLYDVAIVGGGPSGVAAAIYSARKGLKVVMIADRIGGQVKDTMDIENLISVPKTTGPVLAGELSALLQNHSVVLREYLRVDSIEDGNPKKIRLNTGETLESKTVLISTGAKWRELNVPGEKQYIGNGVAYCPHCDGPFFKNKNVAVVGGGNSGIEAALDLAGIVKSVHVIEFGDKLNADKVLLNRLANTPNITATTNAETRSVNGDGNKVVGLTYRDRNTKDEKEISLDGVFVQIGLLPNSGFVKDLLEINRMGEIIVDEKCRTSVQGIFACGDVTNVPYKQIVIAMGEGAKASLSAFEYLLKLPVESKKEVAA